MQTLKADPGAPAAPDLLARYRAAEAMLPHRLRRLITSPNVVPHWIGDGEVFWYRNQTAAGHEFVIVDAEAGTRRLAFDHERLANALGNLLEVELDATSLPLGDLDFQGRLLRCTFGAQRLEVQLDTYSSAVVGSIAMGEATSPDGRWAVLQRDHNLFIRDTASQEERQLTSDGVDGHAYGAMNDQVSMSVMRENLGIQSPPQVVWSPDSTRFITHRLDQRGVEYMHLVRSSPFDGGRPRLLSYRYALPGDEKVAHAEFFIFDAATGDSVRANLPPINMPFVPAIAYGWVWWSHDQAGVYFLANDRGDHNGALHRIDAATGEVRVLVRESSASQILYGPQQHDRNVRTLSTGEVLWWSQRSGWAHLYLYAADGSSRALTAGDWNVRHVLAIDEEARRVVFTASGHDREADPYLQQICSVSLEGGEVVAVTADGLDHSVTASPSGRFLVDVASRWDVPATATLRDRAGAPLLELERSDAGALYATGWTAPERAVVKAADGVTDIYCAIYRPHDFDPARSYPVLDCIYPGPQMSCAPLRFPLSGGTLTASGMAFNFPDAMAALGFVVVIADGRGAALRSKEFQDRARLQGDGVFVDDHVAAIKQLAAGRPWMDLERVGIYGYSAGGYASARAILQAPDFYKVAVSSSGNHDNRLNHSWWGEKFFGPRGEFDYDRQANAALADQLKGKLFLIHGEMDDNATPHGTMRLVDALIKANKDFDLLIIPNADHFMMVTREYFVRRRWDYFVRHLLGETPPPYRLDEIPIEPLG